MFSGKKIVWAKFTSSFPGCSKTDVVNNFTSKLNVNEEYKEAFRTKSYIEIYGKVQASMSRIPSSSPSSLPLYMHFSESLLDPRQETLMGMTESLNLHPLLLDYFKASLEACNICEVLIRGVHQTLKTYKKIKRVLKITRRLHDGAIDHHPDILNKTVFDELAAFALLKNPLSIISPARFQDIHDGNTALLGRLNSECRKLRRKARFSKLIIKKAMGCGLVISHSVLVVALVVIAIHSVVGILAAPGLMACSFVLMKRKLFKGAAKEVKGLRRTRLLKRVGSQLDVAAKAVYILMNDFDTISRLAKRLQDEVEHWKVDTEMCIRNGRNEVLKEVVKEFFNQEMYFMEQLEELEQHIYLCFLTINRSRRLVLQEIMLTEND